MSKIPKVSVIILSWNGKKDTLGAIASLIKSSIEGFEMEIMAVDNASSDGSVGAIEKINPGRKFLGGKIKIIKNSQNLGFTGGNNAGMQDAVRRGFDYIALLNNDTEVDPDLIKNILFEHKKHKQAGAISPKIYFAPGFEFHKRYQKSEEGKVIWYAGGDMDWNNVYGSNHGVDEVDRGQFNETKETDFATGCFVMYKTEALKQAGFYDDRYFTYMEDADHAQKLKRKGWKILFSPKGMLWHKVSQSSGIGSEMNDYYLTRNRMLFGMKYASLRTKFALLRESVKLLFIGRPWQKIGIRDFYLGKFGRGSWV